ncbi:MAG: hypothetical protein Q9218_003510 [Villophora microphyllina]
MRLFVLPISTKRSLIYCQRLNNQLSSETTYVDKLTTRASATWLKWEKAESGWQKKVTAYGNKLFERIPHEEWGLKSVPPLSKRRGGEELKGGKEVEVQFPGSVVSEEGVIEALKTFAGQERQGFHTKWMWGSIIGMPISAPHIDFLLRRQLLRLTAPPKLDLAYELGGMDVSMKKIDLEVSETIKGTPNKSSGAGAEIEVESERMLLTQSDGKTIADLVEVPELEEHVQRAVKQVEKALRAKREYREEKQELDNVNKEAETKR